MPTLSYRQPGLVLRRDAAAADRQVRDLQHDLRKLGYLRSGIDGQFGPGSERAVKALQYDLLHNAGAGSDAAAPVRVVDYNRSRVTRVTGKADQALVECISDILDDPNFCTLPRATDPVAENRRIASEIAQMPAGAVPIPFLLAILKQESDLKHYHEPRPGDEDTYIVVGLDANAGADYIITSRGYGAGQYTLFHHPPRREEVNDFMLDVGKNISKAARELREKFDRFIVGSTRGTRADDRLAEIGTGPLRVCKYAAADPRYLRGCKQCLKNAGLTIIRAGSTPVYEGASLAYRPTQYHREANYSDVPVRKNISCDWPYAVRRYNGSGINSYHYQVRVLKHLLALDIL
jgi:peptidoglycan hydrolase-like protein with peptidoglycan-binding domain